MAVASERNQLCEDFLPIVASGQLEETGDGPPTLRQLLDYELPSEAVCRVILRLMRRLLCRRSEASWILVQDALSVVAEAAAAEREWLAPWMRQWLELEEEERRSLSIMVVNGFVSLPVQVQARHLALVIDAHLAHHSVLAGSLHLEDEAQGNPQLERIHRGARVYRASLAALAALSDSELDSIGQAAVAEAEKTTSPITMARVVLHLSPGRRRQLMDILVQENVLEEASALRLFRALSALESILGADALEAVLTGMDAAASATAGIMDLGSGMMAAGASVLDSVAVGTTSSMDALGSWTSSIFGLQDGEATEVAPEGNHVQPQDVQDQAIGRFLIKRKKQQFVLLQHPSPQERGAGLTLHKRMRLRINETGTTSCRLKILSDGKAPSLDGILALSGRSFSSAALSAQLPAPSFAGGLADCLSSKATDNRLRGSSRAIC
eukprot:s15_g51.t2